MSSNLIARTGTANLYDNTIRNLQAQQTTLAQQQEHLSAGKRVLRASDDPVAAAQAERARTRISRNETDLRALNAQKDSMALAESTLGSTMNAMQAFRELVVQAGNGTLSATDRNTIALQLQGLREQILGYANSKDANGLPLFQALGSASTPFTGASPPTTFSGLPGQFASGTTSIAPLLDGDAAWMSVPTGNGVFAVTATPGNAGTAQVTADQVTNPAAAGDGHSYQVKFTVDTTTGATTYTVTDQTPPPATPTTGLPTSLTYTSPTTISFAGRAIDITGAPANGDSFTVAPSRQTSVFQVLDDTIAAIRSGNPSTVYSGIAQGLSQIDVAMSRLSDARGLAGELLNRADRIQSDLDTRGTQLEAQRSSAEDLDMIKGISDFQNQNTSYQAALQSYAQVQKLSLLNYLG